MFAREYIFINFLPLVNLPQPELGASLGYKLKPAWVLRAAASSPDGSLEFCAAE